MKTNSVTRLGAILVDAYSIRKMLPYLEKIMLNTRVQFYTTDSPRSHRLY